MYYSTTPQPVETRSKIIPVQAIEDKQDLGLS
jgi:hypothetical protein